MINDNFTFAIHDIRTALKNAQRSTLTNKSVNVVAIHDMIDELTREMKRQAAAMDQSAREALASELLVIASDLEALEQLIKQHMMEGSN